MIKKVLFSAAALGFFFSSYAQSIWESPQPMSYQIEAYSGLIPEAIVLQSPDMNQVEVEDAIMAQEEGRDRAGILLPVHYDLLAEGDWYEMTDGDKFCRATFKAGDAAGIKLLFENYELAEGTELNVYSRDRSHWDGPYTSENSGSDSHVFVSGTIFGDEIVVEYFEPASTQGQTTIGVSNIAYMYKGVEDPRLNVDSRGSEACQVDVICPEADEFRVEVDATVRLEIVAGGGVFLCSGALVNNTAFDETPYIYSAYHCVDNVGDDEWALLEVRFSYERGSCGGGFGPSNRKRIGVIPRAMSTSLSGGSDFALFEIEDEIDEAWPHFYAGWTTSTAPGTSGVGIHHPSGDYKKISTYISTLQNINGGRRWNVTWTGTESGWGVTEGGSSGSPIYNQDKYIVGSLSTGASFCDALTAPDQYGQFAYAWAEGAADNRRLQPWLDPDNTGETTVEGSYDPENGIFNTSVTEVSTTDLFEVYPNPTNGLLTVAATSEAKITHIEIYDVLGKRMDVWGVADLTNILDLNHYPAGAYVVKAYSKNKSIGNQRIVVR